MAFDFLPTVGSRLQRDTDGNAALAASGDYPEAEMSSDFAAMLGEMEADLPDLTALAGQSVPEGPEQRLTPPAEQ